MNQWLFLTLWFIVGGPKLADVNVNGKYHISANSLHGNYSFFGSVKCRKFQVVVAKIFSLSIFLTKYRLQKLFKGGNYLLQYGTSDTIASRI
jgi:hypothetical protein